MISRWGAVVLTLMLVAVACTTTSQVATDRPLTTPVPTETPASTEAPASTETPAPNTTPEPTPAATAAPEPTGQPTSEPTATATPEPTVTPEPTPTPQPPGPCNAGPLAVANPDRPRYRATLDIDPGTRTAQGSLSVDFTPDQPIDELVFRLWPNGPRPAAGGTSIQLTSVAVEGEPVTPLIEDPTLAEVPLAETLLAGETITAELEFTVFVPVELNSRLSGRDDYLRLGTILPLLPWEPGRGWARDPATSLFAEAVSSPVADYDVEVTVPEGFNVLASGVNDDGVWRVESARDFALSVGRFDLVQGTAMAPEPVQVTVGMHETIGENPQAYLDKVIDSLEQFSSRWGQYPWPSLTFALTPNLSGGIEFPTHIMQGPNTIGRVTSHEVGHMFFYSLVGNNQGSAPWLDEGLTSYAEFTYEGTAANAFEIPAAGVGHADEPMTFWEGQSSIYYRSVYAQTGFALQLLGSQDDVDCALARYVAANAHQIATADDFVAAFEPTFPDIVEQMAALGVVLTD